MLTKAGRSFVVRLALSLILILGTLGMQSPKPVLAATLTVINTNDSGAGSLRQAIVDSASGGTIKFDSSLAGQTITLASDLTINKDLTVDGSGLSPQVTINGGNVAHVVVQGFVVTISDLTIANGYTSGNGGAIFSGGILTLDNMMLRNNVAANSGGAVYAAHLTIKNTAVYLNQASGGGAISVPGNGMSTIVNSTITQNQASSGGGAIFMQGNAQAQVFNSTFAHNTAPTGSELYLISNIDLLLSNTILACDPGISSCIVQSGNPLLFSPNTIIGTGTLASFGLGELTDNGGPTKTMALLPGSPLIDAGDDTTCTDTPVNGLDQRGAGRPQGKHCDIGAVEKDVPTYRVAPNGASDPACGADWSNPCDLHYALTNLADAESEIWAKEGVYVPGAARTDTFPLVDGVELYGGFAGTERTQIARDPATHITILSGDLNGNDNTLIAADEPTRADNAYHVVSSSSVGNDTLIDGFTISGGNANGNTLPSNRGGGMYNDQSDPTLTNVIFINNSAIFGGGMYNDGADFFPSGSAPILTNVSFLNNAATEGGGLENMNHSSPSLNRVVFSGNSAIRSGGGMENFNYSSPTLTDTTFSDNTASVGGGLMNWVGNNPTLTNVAFSGNSASEAGGGLANYQSGPSLTNVTFSGNSAAQHGGGMHNDDGGNPILTNVTFSGNQAPIGAGLHNGYGSNPKITNSILYGDPGGEVYSVSGTPAITYSLVQGGYPGIGNLDADPLLGPLQDNGGFTQTLALGTGSPALDAADEVTCPLTDQRGITRPQGVACDMGSYEYYDGPISARETIRVSLGSNGLQTNADNRTASISADGRYIAFASWATNLVANDTNGTFDIFVRDTQTGITTCVSVDSNGNLAATSGGSFVPSISADGRFVAFYSNAANLVAGDVNGTTDVFVHDMQTGDTSLVSVSSDEVQANQQSYTPSISADGRYVAFVSSATNLVAGDTNNVTDIFVRDLQMGTTSRLSVSSSGIQANGQSFDPSTSADGRYIAFASEAINLVPSDTNADEDVFLRDLQTGTTTLVSANSSGIQGNNGSRYPSISADGRYIAFRSFSSNLVPGDTNADYDVFVRDMQSSLTSLVSVNSNGVQGNGYIQNLSMSADGRYVAFQSDAANLVPNDTNGTTDIFVHDIQSGSTLRASVSSSRAQGNSMSIEPAISADGRFIAFTSAANNLVPGDTNGVWDIFVHRQNIVSASPPTEAASLKVYLAGSNIDNPTVPFHTTKRVSYTGMNNGPVRISSTNSISILASERVIYKVNNVNTSFSELMALPDSQLDKTYWLPWYNNVDLDTQLRLGNVSGSTATVNVYIGSTLMTPTAITLLPGESTRKSFAANNGPVKIVSNVNIVAAERVVYKVNNVNTSFSEMMALPNSQLTNIYWLPWYNNVDLDTQLRFGNVSGLTAHVHVYIGKDEMAGSPFTLQPGEGTRQSFAGINNGPVKIQSDQNIVVAERVIYKVNGTPTSFTETMALPDSQLNTTYWLPWYNNVDLDTQLRFGNVSNNPATVHVLIGGLEVAGSPFTLQPGESTRQSFAGINNGPVKIQSDQPIVAAERVIYKVSNVNTSFSEMMGLPDSLLNTTYWLPWYNNVDLDTQLRFGVP